MLMMSEIIIVIRDSSMELGKSIMYGKSKMSVLEWHLEMIKERSYAIENLTGYALRQYYSILAKCL